MVAKNLMSKQFFTVGPNDKLAALAELLKSKHVSGVPVLANGKVVGVVGEGDLLTHRSHSGAVNVKAIMHRNVPNVTVDQPIDSVAQLMADRNLELVPVVRDGSVVGTITQDDIVSAVAIGVHPAERSPIYDL